MAYYVYHKWSQGSLESHYRPYYDEVIDELGIAPMSFENKPRKKAGIIYAVRALHSRGGFDYDTYALGKLNIATDYLLEAGFNSEQVEKIIALLKK